jgi:lipopolysaccharide export system permease protein
MKLIDKYIIKRYLGTFSIMIMLFIPIGIMVDIAEKIDKFKENEVPVDALINYYIDFTWYFANLLFPIFLFLSVIWFTSKLANNTEVTAILSSGISFNRFIRPFMISALFIAIVTFLMGMFIVPNSNKGFNEFSFKYLKKKGERNTNYVFKQISNDEYIYVSSYNPIRKRANNFTLEKFKNQQMIIKINAESIRWIPKDSIFRLTSFKKRVFNGDNEILQKAIYKDTIFDFRIQDLAPVNYKAETLNMFQLNDFINEEKKNGSILINSHLLTRHKRYSLPLASFILTLIAVSMSSNKRRGGMGVNLAIGISLGFLFIFFDKIFGVMVTKSNFSPFFGAWLPLIIFGVISLLLLNYAKR